jgi:hypothetical protein
MIINALGRPDTKFYHFLEMLKFSKNLLFSKEKLKLKRK